MIYKLRTSKETMKIFESIGASEGLQPFILSKISIALSIHAGELTLADLKTNTDGLELNRQTIFGDQELLFKSLIIMNNKKTITDDEFFPKQTKAHLDRGAKLLANEVRYGMNFYSNLLNVDRNI